MRGHLKRTSLPVAAALAVSLLVPAVAPMDDLSILWPSGWYAAPPLELQHENPDTPQPFWTPGALTFVSGAAQATPHLSPSGPVVWRTPWDYPICDVYYWGYEGVSRDSGTPSTLGTLTDMVLKANKPT